MRRHLFTSESVTEGHPDKICDKISDAVLDACLAQDPDARVACETIAKTGIVKIAGEITTKASINFAAIIRGTLRDIGYTKPEYGIDARTCGVVIQVDEQSPDIAQGVNDKEGLHDEQGAGDQGLMFGYACDETEDLMPLPITLAHRLTKRLAQVRKEGIIPYLGPDGKAQVTIEYEKHTPIRIHTIVVSNQHERDIPHGKIVQDIARYVIRPVCGAYVDERTIFHINPTGAFVLGGPHADCGLTGRKIIVDTYGGYARHGGGAFSGKDPSKVDRSAAYAARYIAKNIVASGLAKRCEVQLAYAIGVAEPVSLYIDCFATAQLPEERIEQAVRQVFPLKPAQIIKDLNLKRPIYYATAANGHFGGKEFPWEQTDKVKELQEAVAKEVSVLSKV